ncbi:DUF3649 domain-containing protein [Gluconacetobacter azotocaptans]|uniref:DUF3649 domain-containing protein n=1 Tax=Gluconacetobacter azotocaptans TaxID=142834 RepID=A0A7W4JQ41_9PROT|nr:DUF3649 domain-containing protein [Gluconacetobacter azotocaptans]MBB2188831.1 DUF3649 domain-containing protein [Gluconacetobacter azotocaptans]MBM9402543.1 DUF3649 domain-containing protein [Gluconacetobacter azotocaptans]GBQ31169.1 hypothetical protein AA13594_1988 [Gluconacetobacter azotocaptans DSM 13594]
MTRGHLAIVARIAAGAGGGYGVASLVAVAAAYGLPMSRADAASAGAMLGLLVWPPIVMACFYARSATRAWMGIILAALLLGGAAMLAGWRP